MNRFLAPVCSTLLVVVALARPTAVHGEVADLAVASFAATPDPVNAGDQLEYTVEIRNLGPDQAPATVLTTALPPALTLLSSTGCAEDPAGIPTCSLGAVAAPVLRVTEYRIAPGTFNGAALIFDLAYDLMPDYFVLLRGSGLDGAAQTAPSEDFVRLTDDPFGTGDLNSTAELNRIKLKRGAGIGNWVGVLTVVECLADCDVNGFRLVTAAEVVHPATDDAVAGNVLAPAAWGDAARVTLLGGLRGAGCQTGESDPANHPVCHARYVPTGAATIHWTRDTTSASLAGGATATVMAVRWGSAWQVQRVRVTTDAGANGAATLAAYGTAAIQPVARDHTWVWGSGHTAGNAGGTSADGVLVTLGNGVDQNPVESTVAVGSEHPGQHLDFEAAVLTHPQLVVDHVFKADGDAGATSVVVPVAAATGPNRMALTSNGLAATGGGYPATLLSARYSADDTVTLERRLAGSAFPAWVEAIDVGGIHDADGARQVTLTVAVAPAAGTSVSTTVSVASDATDPVAGNDTATATTAVAQLADLGLTIADDLDPVIAGRPIAYTLTVANQGPSDADGATVTTSLDPLLVAVDTAGCVEDPAGWPWCTLGVTPAGGTTGFVLRATTAPETRGSVDLTATVASDATDPEPGDNTATETTRLTGEIPVGRGGAPALSGDLGGSARFVVAWEEDTTTDTPRAADAIRGRLFSPDGMPIGVELDIASGGATVRGEADVAFTAGSELVVAWHEDGSDGDGFGIRARRYSADGMPIGVELEVNAATANDQTDPALAAIDDGVVVTWADELSPGAYRHAVRRFAADGMPIGVELYFGASGIAATPPTVAAANDGRFLIAWRNALDRIAAQRFAADGMPIGVELEIDGGAGTQSAFPTAVWHPRGAYFVAWQNDSDGDASGIRARFVDPDGMPIGVELQVNSTTAGAQTRPVVAVDSVGELIVAWQSDDPSGERILAQRLSSDGMPIGVELQIDRSPGGVTSRPAVAYVADGQFYVAWQRADSDGDGSDEIVGGLPPLVFGDDFESGGTAAWSATNP